MESCLTFTRHIWEQIGCLLIYSLLEIITDYHNENQLLAVKILKEDRHNLSSASPINLDK